MNQIVGAYPDRDLHVVLDNLNTHKPKQDRWLKRHPRVHLHFIPTYSSWLNQVECWFSILGQQALQGVSFTSPTQLREAIDKFVKADNQNASPFEWTVGLDSALAGPLYEIAVSRPVARFPSTP